MKGFCIVVSSLMVVAAIHVGAQDYSQQQYYPNPAPPPAPEGQILTGDQLDQLLGPVALYPDPLIAEILPAATQPSQIAVAANYVNSGGDPSQIDSQPWDSSVKAIAHDPQLLQLLNGNLEWTAELGQAYANQPEDVMNSIQRLRAEAMQEGNLQSNPQETVENYDGQIEIVPANPEMLYVPEYDPGAVYFEPGVGISWGFGFPLGPWFDHDFDWWHHRMVYWDHDHPRPHDWWHERPGMRREAIGRAPVWRPPRPPVPHGGGLLGHLFSPFSHGGDRGYAPVPPREMPRREVAPREMPRPGISPRESRPAVVPRAPAPREAPRPAFTPREAPRPAAPAPRQSFGAFSHESASQARAASNRGAESRGGGGGGGNRGGGGGNQQHHR